MKKITVFLLIMAMWRPAYAVAILDNIRSYFTDDPIYTIDKRKYVSRDIEPFSAVVGLKHSDSENWCTGTLTSDGIIVTAKHCIFDEDDGTYEPTNKLYINHENAGDVGIKRIGASGDDDASDWAILVPKENIKSTVLVVGANNNITTDVVSAGYGSLKILSDQEIRKIRTEYSKWLNRMTRTNIAGKFGTDLDKLSDFGYMFVNDICEDKISEISSDIFNDANRLKASYCRATASNQYQNYEGCQSWGGNSGGSVFVNYDNKWYLYGIHVGGNSKITNNRNTYAKATHMVPINTLIKHYKELVSELKGNKNEKQN